MPLSNFTVVPEHSWPSDPVLVHCLTHDAQAVTVLIPREEIVSYFHRDDLTLPQRNLLISANLDKLVPIILAKYERSEVSTYTTPTGRVHPCIYLTLLDLNNSAEKLTDTVLEIAAGAGWQPAGAGWQLTATGKIGKIDSDKSGAPPSSREPVGGPPSFAFDVPDAGLDQGTWVAPAQISLTPPVAGATSISPYGTTPYGVPGYHFGSAWSGDAAGFGQAPFPSGPREPVLTPDILAALDWLKNQPVNVLMTITARIALRMLPLIVDVNRIAKSRDFARRLALPMFRATAMAWYGAKYPSSRISLRGAAAATAASIAGGYAHTAAATRAAVIAENAVQIIAWSYAQTAGASEAGAAQIDRANASEPLKYTEGSLRQAWDAVATFVTDITSAQAELIAAVAADASAVEAAASHDGREDVAVEQAAQPLWPVVVPAWIAAAWEELKTSLMRAEEDWEVWIEWYEDRLAGRISPDPAIDIACVTINEQLWEQGPKAVNAAIRHLLDKTSLEAIPAQGAGPHFTISPASRIILAPPAEFDPSGNNVQRIRQLLPLTRRAVDDLLGTLNSNAFPELFRNASQYREAIADGVEKIAWGTVFGLGVMLENAADAVQRQIPDRVFPSLEDAAQAALETVLTLHGPLTLATAEGRELMEQADRLRLTREQQEALRADAQTLARRLQQASDLIERPLANTIAEAVDLIGTGPHTERGTAFGVVTVGHLATILVPAGVLAAFGALIGSIVGPVGTAVGGAVGSAGSLVLKENERVRRAARALSSHYDQLVDAALGQAALVKDQAISSLHALTPFREFVRTNEEPLRRIASNSRQLRWIRGYIDFVIQPYKDEEINESLLPVDREETISGEVKAGDRVNVKGNGRTVGPGRVIGATGDPVDVIVERPNRDPYVFRVSRSFFRAVGPGAWQLDVPGPVLRQFLSD